MKLIIAYNIVYLGLKVFNVVYIYMLKNGCKANKPCLVIKSNHGLA